MLSITRFETPSAERAQLLELAEVALAALSVRDGYRSGSFAQNLDEPDSYVLVTEWDGVGAYRRALGHPDVKLAAYPLLFRCLDEPSAFGPVLTVGHDEPVRRHATDLQ